ncbi:MAG TPA: isochorismatase, partial [Blastocatellia bacterium]
MIKLQEVHQPRPIRFLDLWEISGFRMKVYGIAYRRNMPRNKFIRAARKIAERRLTESASKTNHYGAGYVGIHDGRTAGLIFVDWWADENELHHHVYVFPADKSDDVQYVT